MLLSLLAGSALTACGEHPSDPVATGDGWQTQHLDGDPATDFPTILATDRDDALVLMVSDEGVLQSHLSADGADFEAGEPLETGQRYVNLAGAVRLADGSWFTVGSGGVVRADGDEEMVFDALAFRSHDGLAWEPVEVGGFDDAVELNDIEVAGETIVVAGDHRTLRDPSMGGFEARVWVSEDGAAWEEAALPGVPPYRDYDDESYVGDVVATADGLLASGRVGRHAALWRSADDGRSWERVADPAVEDAYAINGMHANGSTIVASTSGSDVQAIRSEDGGRTWEPVGSLPVDEETEGWAPLWAGGGRFLTLTGVDDTSWSEPEVCYADPGQCGRSPGPALVASEDGKGWTTVHTEGLGEIDEIVGTEDGRLLVMSGDGEGRTIHTWSAGTPLPVADQPALPETVELVEVPKGEDPEVGVRYHAPMYVHCGMDWLWFADTTWRRTDGGPGVETGAGEESPEDWPLVGETIFGYATVRGDGVLEYSVGDGEVIATYERRGGARGCA